LHLPAPPYAFARAFSFSALDNAAKFALFNSTQLLKAVKLASTIKIEKRNLKLFYFKCTKIISTIITTFDIKTQNCQ